ncbi:hypothetical protein CY34DRAFT_516424 [Suillus luteus UH-Slu-Lm8-n1]|uniref:Unplaced genomic scaffold CY34scaffold_4, whole genome shotgun sequence n=1 Tax=Suillus luteus UH-Slu-Lm8-n1 TaxID=930992 RepID=A0A0D0C1V8_9AGAM|nr:hypothetical protein CY34DRAFT_516424 [Suillus luteus UH-Slu-Lm8-n1]
MDPDLLCKRPRRAQVRSARKNIQVMEYIKHRGIESKFQRMNREQPPSSRGCSLVATAMPQSRF